jgi:hypothetical protein
VALKNVTAAQFKANLEASFVSGIASDLKVTEDLVVVTSVTTLNSGRSTRRRVLLQTAGGGGGDALDVVGLYKLNVVDLQRLKGPGLNP